jgi:hypothetical protein
MPTLERRALLICRGVGQAANWDKALDSLASAAERGSHFAARQLVMLADDRFEPAEPIIAARPVTCWCSEMWIPRAGRTQGRSMPDARPPPARNGSSRNGYGDEPRVEADNIVPRP